MKAAPRQQGDAAVTSASGLQAYASRTLDLLQLIEKTVGRLSADTELLRVWPMTFAR